MFTPSLQLLFNNQFKSPVASRSIFIGLFVSSGLMMTSTSLWAQTSPPCLSEAHSHFLYISGLKLEEAKDFRTSIDVLPFHEFKKVSYTFYQKDNDGYKVDSWRIEMLQQDCFPLKLEYLGDF